MVCDYKVGKRDTLICLGFAIPCIVISFCILYVLQVGGYGAIVKTFAFNRYSPFTWFLIATIAHGIVQLFRYYDIKKRKVVLCHLIRRYAIFYALVLGVLMGYAVGSTQRFLRCKVVMDYGDQICLEIERHMKVEKNFSPEQLFASESAREAMADGINIQMRPLADGITSIGDADLTVFFEGDSFALAIPYDLPYLLMSGISESRIFIRTSDNAYWIKKYIKLHIGSHIEIADE